MPDGSGVFGSVPERYAARADESAGAADRGSDSLEYGGLAVILNLFQDPCGIPRVWILKQVQYDKRRVGHANLSVRQSVSHRLCRFWDKFPG